MKHLTIAAICSFAIILSSACGHSDDDGSTCHYSTDAGTQQDTSTGVVEFEPKNQSMQNPREDQLFMCNTSVDQDTPRHKCNHPDGCWWVRLPSDPESGQLGDVVCSCANIPNDWRDKCEDYRMGY